jgi:hypothetical protein
MSPKGIQILTHAERVYEPLFEISNTPPTPTECDAAGAREFLEDRYRRKWVSVKLMPIKVPATELAYSVL